MRINSKTFFEVYITSPLSKELTREQKILAVALSILLFPITIALYAYRNPYWNNKIVQLYHQNIAANHTPWCETVLKAQRVAIGTLDSPGIIPLTPRSTEIVHPTQRQPISLGEVPNLIQDHFIEKYYSKPLPHKKDVTVNVTDPETGETIQKRWVELSRNEKIQVNNAGTHAHNQLSPYTPEWLVDTWFFAHGQSPYLDNDPRKSHGNDHCVRTAIFAGVFAYLYNKYHPDYSVNKQTIATCQLLAAGHDAGRQTEGPDVYDRDSGKIVRQLFEELGETDLALLNTYEKAIVEKDCPNIKEKSLYQKCVQNADCAEFARLKLSSSIQNKSQFKASAEYLDIFKEMKQRASQALKTGGPSDINQVVLKVSSKTGQQLTYGDFDKELTFLREEMNRFIYLTHQGKFRDQVAIRGKNAYNELLNFITPSEYPVLHEVLVQAGIKTPLPSDVEIAVEENLKKIRGWALFGFDKIATLTLKNMEKTLKECQKQIALNQSDSNLLNEIESLINLRTETKIAFEKSLSKQPFDFFELAYAYAKLPQHLKWQYRPIFVDHLKKFPRQELFNNYHLDDATKIFKYFNGQDKLKASDLIEVVNLIASEYHQEKIKEILESVRKNERLTNDQQIDSIRIHCEKAINCYKKANPKDFDATILTTVSLGYRKMVDMHLSLGNDHLAQQCLQKAAREIPLPFSSHLEALKQAARANGNNSAIYFPSDCGYLRKRRMRLSHKVFENKKCFEFSFEMPHKDRANLEKYLNLIPEELKNTSQALYESKNDTTFNVDKGLKIGQDIKISLPSGAVIHVGDSQKYWNHHHLVRIRVDEHTPIEEIHKAFCMIGLPMALMPSRDEDVHNEMLARIIAIRFPKVLYSNPKDRLSPKEAFAKLNVEQQAIVERDMSRAVLKEVNKGAYEFVIPHLGDEAKQLGVKGLGAFIYGGASFESTAEVMANILTHGMLSSQERYQRGILNLGCVPLWNYEMGSGNQVFARMLNEKLFNDEFKLKNFAVPGQIFILVDTSAMERLPYFYREDSGGIRNPHYRKKIFHAQKQFVQINFRGAEKIRNREGFTEHLERMKQRSYPLNEIMFDLSVGPKYIKKLLVSTEIEKNTLIATLERKGIFHINQTKLQDAIVVTDRLTSDLVDSPNDVSKNFCPTDINYALP